MSKSEHYFNEELSQFTNDDIKTFTIHVLDNEVPEYFWRAACSTTGKYHPPWNQGNGGIVRHIKVTSWLGVELTRAMPLTESDRRLCGFGDATFEDVIRSACMLHDGYKHGTKFNGSRQSIIPNNTEKHGVDFAMKLYNDLFKGSKEHPLTYQYKCILAGIAGHMGRWTCKDAGYVEHIPENKEDDVLRKVATIVHLADYFSSRQVPPHIAQLVKEVIGSGRK